MTAFDTYDQSQQDGEPVDLVSLVGPGFVYRYASGDRAIAVDADGDTIVETYAASAVKLGRAKVGDLAADVDAEVTLPASDALVRQYQAGPIAGFGPPPRSVLCRAYRYQVGAGLARQVARGFVGGMRFETQAQGRVAILRVPSGTVDALSTPIPAVVLQRACNAVLGDARCKYNIEGVVTLATITTAAPDGRSLTVSANGGTGQYHQYGTILDVASGELRGITNQSGLTLSIGPLPFRTVPASLVGRSVKIYPGCDLTIATCKTKFGNVVNFRGHPQSQYSNPWTVGILNVRRSS